MPETTVVNIHRSHPRDYDVYIGRGSKWGNPYHEGEHGTREEVIEQYELYLQGRPELLAALPELQGRVLGCYCKPKACHGDILARYADGEQHG